MEKTQKFLNIYFELYFLIDYIIHTSTWYSGYTIYYNLKYPEYFESLCKLIRNSISEIHMQFDFNYDHNIIRIYTEKIEKIRDLKCGICLEGYTSIPFVLNCGHFFHKDCIHSWKINCPLCKMALT